MANDAWGDLFPNHSIHNLEHWDPIIGLYVWNLRGKVLQVDNGVFSRISSHAGSGKGTAQRLYKGRGTILVLMVWCREWYQVCLVVRND